MTMYLPTSKACLAIILVVITCAALTSCRHNSNAYGKSRPARSTSGKPEIVERPKSQDVHVGQQATFVCRVKSNLPVKITWMKQEMVLNDRPGSLLLANNSLIILHVQKSDGGIYKCIAKNNAGSSSAEATLKVLDPLIAPVITEISRNKTIQEGERVTFICKANGNPLPRIKWEIENVADADPEQPSPGSIRILHATPKHSGYYRCIAVNEKGNDTRVIYLTVIGYPVFVESPVLNLTVVENTTVSLNCKVIGSPAPDVTWYFHNTPAIQIKNAAVFSNKTLIISHVKFEDSGIYTCTANNSAGLRRSKSTLLRVRRKPRFPNNFNIMKNQTAIDGEPMSLNCFAAGYPEPKYDWRFNNQTVSQSSVFTIPRVSKTSEGVYSCKAYNNLGALLVKILLSVVVPPKVSVKPERRLVLSGDSAEFLCSATGDPVPEIIWYLLQGGTWHNNSLVIANVSVNDGGEYSCEAKSRAGKKLAKGELVVAVRPTFKDVPPRNITVNEESSVSVSCTAKGPDQPVINWYRLTADRKLINISAGDKISTSSGTLKISHIVRDDGGLYSCEAKNYAGVINTNFFINVQYPPYLIVPAQNVSIVAGKMALIHCPVQSNPTAQIQWISPKSFDGPYLSIMNVDTSHGGQYVCRGFNSLGTLQATVDVTVLAPPRIIGLKKEEKQNNWTSLTCETKGTPEPNVSWLDQTPLPSGSFTVHRGILHLEKRFVDKMMFICNASNAYGWSSMHVKIPSSPYKFSVIKITSSSVTLSWLANSTEIIPHFVIERLSKDDSNWIVVSSLVSFSGFTVHDLQAFTWFLFRVSARNVLGTSEPSTTLNITTLEGVPSRPTNFAAESRELTSITVGWKPPKEPRGLLASVIYELFYMEHSSSPDLEMKININNSVQYRLKLSHLKSNSLYIMKVRAGRKANDGVVYWSDYVSIRLETLREAPPVSPKILKAVSNGPRRIFVSWERPTYYVDGYELRYKEYESVNVTSLLIMSWNTTSRMITGLTSNHYYEIQLRMYTSGGKGPWSVPVVVHTDQDKLALPGPLSSSSDSLPWKIALGASLLALVLLSLLLLYMYSVRRSKRTTDDSGKKEKKKFHNKNGYDFDNASRVSNESDGSVEGIYNVNMEDDIDLSMFDSGHHSGATGPASTMYVENPILPSDKLESDDSYEAVRLATFTARPSPLPTPGGSPYLTGRRQISSSAMSSPQYPDFPEPPVYAKVDFAAREGSRNKSADNTSEQISDDILI